LSVDRENEIIEEYLLVGAKNEINVPETVRAAILSIRGTNNNNIFAEAQKYVTHMMIRNVDHTWKYTQIIPPPKILKGTELRREIEKVAQNSRHADLIQFFLTRKITSLMYSMRAPVASKLNKLRSTVPIGTAHITIKNLTGHKFSPSTCLYFRGKSFYEYESGNIKDKTSRVRTSTKSGLHHFNWGEKILFDVLEFKVQVIQLELWERKLARSVHHSTFVLKLADLMDDALVRSSTELIIKNKNVGKILVFFDYYTNELEVSRILKEKEAKENAKKATQYVWLL